MNQLLDEVEGRLEREIERNGRLEGPGRDKLGMREGF